MSEIRTSWRDRNVNIVTIVIHYRVIIAIIVIFSVAKYFIFIPAICLFFFCTQCSLQQLFMFCISVYTVSVCGAT